MYAPLRLAIASLLAASSSLCVAASEFEAIYSNDFNQYPKAKAYTPADFLFDWKKPIWENGVNSKRVAIALGPDASGKTNSALAITYPKGQIGSKKSGAQWKYYFAKGYEEASLSYRIKFPKDFDFVRGGKLPGLAGGEAPTGSNPANGKNGWTARLMWRDNGTAIAYTQHVHSGKKKDGREEDKDYWVQNRKRFQFDKERWYLITQHIKLNQPDQKNGSLAIYINNQIVTERTDIQFRKTNQLQIDQLYFSTFYGGGDKSWAPQKDETIYFDDFKLAGRTKGAIKISSRPNAKR